MRERVLLVAVGDHLERSRVLLVEWMNESEGAAPRGAEELLRTNRLYRASAERDGDADVADVLLELERALLEIARAPEFGAHSGSTPRSPIAPPGACQRLFLLASPAKSGSIGG